MEQIFDQKTRSQVSLRACFLFIRVRFSYTDNSADLCTVKFERYGKESIIQCSDVSGSRCFM